MSIHNETAPASPVLSALGGRCPRCGHGHLFKGLLDLQASCETCGLDFGFADAGDGPAVFVSLIGGAIVIGLALWTDINYEPPLWLDMSIFFPLTLVVCLGVLRPIKALLIGLRYRHTAGEGRLAP